MADPHTVLSAKKSQLLIVDVQERLLPVMHDGAAVEAGCAILLQAAGHLSVPICISEQYPKGLGHTVPSLMSHVETAKTFEKLTFSCLGEPALANDLIARRRSGRNQVVVAGIEAHVCVLQTCLGLRARGFDVFVVADAISARAPASVDIALSRLARGGVMPVTVEMVAFEWLGRAGTDEFKAISALVK